MGQFGQKLGKFYNFLEVTTRNFDEKFKSALRKCGNIFSVWTERGFGIPPTNLDP